MATQSQQQKPVRSSSTPLNPYESLRDIPFDTVKQTGSAIKQIGSGIFDDLFGLGAARQAGETRSRNPFESSPFGKPKAEKARPSMRREVFSFKERESQIELQKVRELVKQIQEQVVALKRQAQEFNSDLENIDKMTVDPKISSTKYHVNFLEIILSILSKIRADIAKGATWLQAASGRKAKKGFAGLTKKGSKDSLNHLFGNERSGAGRSIT